ncbi:hypothetical protein SEA_BOGOTA_50 [Streptomyces phage Bogota]|nr:hypothetical protein SEA_BOGOTA_50 [Streptomyces phage Bogota]
MHSDQCEHLRDTYPHTSADGRVTTIPYCRRCGLEGEAMKRKPLPFNPYIRYRLPRKRWQSAAMALVWAGLLAWYLADRPEMPAWLYAAFLVLDVAFIVGNVVAFADYDRLKARSEAAEAARNEMRRGTYWSKEK